MRAKSREIVLEEDISDLQEDIGSLSEMLKLKEDIITKLMAENAYLRSILNDQYGPVRDEDTFISYICTYYKITHNELVGSSRKGLLPFIRQVTAYYLNEEYKKGVTEIGRKLQCDHSTIIYGIARIRTNTGVTKELLKQKLEHGEWIRNFRLNETKY
jgi:chromosomal replication initiation ATPase DnaA